MAGWTEKEIKGKEKRNPRHRLGKVEDMSNAVLRPKKLKCELFELDNLDSDKLVGNAVWFCGYAKDELKDNSILLK